MTRAEARGAVNLPKKDGTEELIIPMNVLVGGQASPQDGVTGTPTDDRGVGEDQEPAA